MRIRPDLIELIDDLAQTAANGVPESRRLVLAMSLDSDLNVSLAELGIAPEDLERVLPWVWREVMRRAANE